MTVISSFPNGGLAVYRFFEVENLGDQATLEGQYVNGEPVGNTQSAILSPASALLPGGALLPGNLVIADSTSVNVTNPNVKRTQAPLAGTLPANAELGVVYGAPWLRYKPTDNAIYAGAFVSVLRGRFVARMDINSFVIGQSPVNLFDKIYAAIQDGVVATKNLGLFSTTPSGTPTNAQVPLGQVVGFETISGYGPGGMVQISANPAAITPTAAPQVLVGGVTLVRVQFDLSGIGVA